MHLYCYLWRCTLSHKDWTLGLHSQHGRQGGYRRRLLEMLEQWESKTNQVLQARFDHVMGDAEDAFRICIVSDSPDRGSGFDTDWSCDDEND